MKNGLAIIEITDNETNAIHFDQELLEMAHFRAQKKKAIAEREAAEREAYRNRRRAEKAEARRRAYNRKTIAYIITRGGLAVCAAWAGFAGLIHPIISIPVMVFCLCAACMRFGVWFGRGTKHE